MCGIWGYVARTNHLGVAQLFEAFGRVQPRGPDRSDFRQFNEIARIYLGFHRLAIMDRGVGGDQPFVLDHNGHSIVVICNGEIYNHRELEQANQIQVTSGSDCEFLPHMYRIHGTDMFARLRGEFGICVVDMDRTNSQINIWIARDMGGVRPVFFGADSNGLGFSSTLAGLHGIIEPSQTRQLERAQIIGICVGANGIETSKSIYHRLDTIGTRVYEPDTLYQTIRETLIGAVHCRLESDLPVGALLSGGLDSSLVCAIASRFVGLRGQRLRTFSIGIDGSTDREYAVMVSEHCQTIHTHIEFTQAEFLEALEQTVRVTETYDITTIRASVGQYLISRWIRQNTDIRVLLIGDGSDELCGGYMYFHNAPTPIDAHHENIRLLKTIQYFDTLRADRCIASNGIEARVPFLDQRFVELYLSLDPVLRVPRVEHMGGRRVEKWLLRKAFDVDGYLPDLVLWRKKEAFSDGVSSCEKSWYTVIQENVKDLYTDEAIGQINPIVQIGQIIPPTREALHYKVLYSKYFDPRVQVIPYYWLPRWSGDSNEPSARVLQVYQS